MQPMGRLSMHSKCLDFFSFKFWGGGSFFFFLLFPSSSLHVPNGVHHVPKMFYMSPMCSPKVFPITPRFNPICFAQSPPLLTYIGGPKGVAPSFHRIFYFGEPPQFQLFFAMGQSNCLIAPKKKKKTVGLVRHPQLINMKQDTYPRS
jgi:hypothetical protein